MCSGSVSGLSFAHSVNRCLYPFFCCPSPRLCSAGLRACCRYTIPTPDHLNIIGLFLSAFECPLTRNARYLVCRTSGYASAATAQRRCERGVVGRQVEVRMRWPQETASHQPYGVWQGLGGKLVVFKLEGYVHIYLYTYTYVAVLH